MLNQGMVNKAEIYRHESGIGTAGYVVLFDAKLCGWTKDLSSPKSWQPGSIAIDAADNQFVSKGGNNYDGATSWKELPQSLPNEAQS